MTVDPAIREQGYVYFLSESQDLLQTIEQELFLLREEPETSRIHTLMRATHTLKGASANVGLETIQTIAHHMEDIFRALFDPEAEVDLELETLLFQIYECLRLALTGELEDNHARDQEVLDSAIDIFAKIQTKLGDCFEREAKLPSSAELGFDIVQSIFETGVQERIDTLTALLDAQDQPGLAEGLAAQVEIFEGLAESLGLPGFRAIAHAIGLALAASPDRVLEIGKAALADLRSAQKAVLAGDRSQGGQVSPALQALTGAAAPVAEAPLLDLTGVDPTELDAVPMDSVPGDATAKDAYPSGDAPEADLDEIMDLGDFCDLELVDETGTNVGIAAEVGGQIESQIRPVPPSRPPSQSQSQPPSQSPSQSPSQQSPPPQSQPQPQQSPPPQSQQPVIQAAPPVASQPVTTPTIVAPEPAPIAPAATAATTPAAKAAPQPAAKPARSTTAPPKKLIRVELDRLQDLQHLVGELLIAQNRQSLQDEQLQTALRNFRRNLRHHQRSLAQLQSAIERGEWVGGDRPALTGSDRPQPAASDLVPLARDPGQTLALNDANLSIGDLLQDITQQAEQLEVTAEIADRYSQQSMQMLEKQQRLLASVRDSLMDARMQPIGTVFNRFPRLVEQMSAKHEKPVNLRLVGEQVPIDKSVVEQLYDPLLHLIRNAFDHGIETPERRQHTPKDPTGTIELRAKQQGNQVTITITDDGGGIDPEKIRQKAIDRNWRSPEAAALMSVDELLDLLFEPGFSTAAQVSDLSGRGVGLDVVKSQISHLKGATRIQSTLGQGTAFILQIPLTLMTARLLICHADRATYALLSDSIAQILIPQPHQTQMLGGQRVLRWQQGDAPEVTIPLRKLSQLVRYSAMQPGQVRLDLPAIVPMLSNRLAPLLLLHSEEGLVALEVDGVVGEQELVLRQFSESIPAPSYIYGCTILGDGRMVLVLDGTSLLRDSDVAPTAVTSRPIEATPEPASLPMAPDPVAARLPAAAAAPSRPVAPAAIAPSSTAAPSTATPSTAAPSTATPSTPPTVPSPPAAASSPTANKGSLLVVEDSDTERKILAITLEKAGYTVFQAADGRQALQQVNQHPNIRLVISDLEMPVMSGLEMLNARRQDPVFSKIPVALLTSCTGKQYRQIATSLGAVDYWTKPHVAAEMLVAIEQHALKV